MDRGQQEKWFKSQLQLIECYAKSRRDDLKDTRYSYERLCEISPTWRANYLRDSGSVWSEMERFKECILCYFHIFSAIKFYRRNDLFQNKLLRDIISERDLWARFQPTFDAYEQNRISFNDAVRQLREFKEWLHDLHNQRLLETMHQKEREGFAKLSAELGNESPARESEVPADIIAMPAAKPSPPAAPVRSLLSTIARKLGG